MLDKIEVFGQLTVGSEPVKLLEYDGSPRVAIFKAWRNALDGGLTYHHMWVVSPKKEIVEYRLAVDR